MEKTIRISLVIAGVISLLFSIFHASFPWMFNWQETLACLNRTNRAILQTFNLGGILMVGAATFFSLRYPKELVSTTLGRPILIVFALFYLIRLVAEFVFFGYEGVSSIVIIILCSIPALAYILAAAVHPQVKQDVEEVGR
jgi:hypothetical protein